MQPFIRYFLKCQSQFHNKLIMFGSFLGMVLLFFTLSSCNKAELTSLDQEQAAGIKDSVQHIAAIIAHDVSQEGPIAWLRHFSHSPEFFMANDGRLVFPNYDSAAVFVKKFATGVRRIQLTWSDLNVDPLTLDLAEMRANFHEVITDTSGHQIPVQGYFTGLFERDSVDWKLRNLHWSTNRQSN